MYKKELLDRYNIQFISQVLHEDIFFTFQCLFLARKVLFIPKKYYFRRIRENSIMTRRYNINNSYSCYISADALEDFCNKYKFYDSCDEVCRFINDVRFQYIDDVLMLDKNQFLIETKKYKVPNDYLNFVDEYGKKNL
jgi:hypothetical protein